MVVKCNINDEKFIYNTLDDAGRFERYNEITYLDCSDNGITKIENLPNSLKEFYFTKNQITRIENLPNNLQIFNCCWNKITKIENLPNSLKKFDCSFNKITKIENLPNSLKKFDCRFNEITKIKNLPDSLKEFDCTKNQITKIENLPNNLQIFNCSWNKITKMENLPNSLKEFDCSINLITKIENLRYYWNEVEVITEEDKRLPEKFSKETLTLMKTSYLLPDSLKKFYCGCNRITKIENTPDSLKEFICFGNQITKMENLPNNLQVFNCCWNKITKIENLPNSLQILWCGNVEIGDDVSENIEINGTKYSKIYQKFLNDEVSEIDVINKLKIKQKIYEMQYSCLICHGNTNCVHLPCHDDHTYCLKCFVSWYYVNQNEKKCCMCMKPFNVEECYFG